MSSPERIQVKFIASPEQVAQLVAEFESVPTEVTVVSTGPEADPTSLEFGLIEAAAVATILTAGFYFAELAHRLYKQLKPDPNAKAKAGEADAHPRTIVVQTPLDRITFVSSRELQEADIQNKLEAMVKVRR